MRVTIYSDGGSLNNPGQAAIGYLIYADDACVHTASQAIGIASNNVAEYTALTEALSATADLITDNTIEQPEQINVFADSELMIKQINGVYKVKNDDIKQCMSRLQAARHRLTAPITFTHVLRAKNANADALVKQALGK